MKRDWINRKGAEIYGILEYLGGIETRNGDREVSTDLGDFRIPRRD